MSIGACCGCESLGQTRATFIARAGHSFQNAIALVIAVFGALDSEDRSFSAGGATVAEQKTLPHRYNGTPSRATTG